VVTAIHEVLKGQVRRADFAARRAARSDRLFIAKIRIAKGVSQTELAPRLGVSKQ
jgi:DNA-binding transcriptional regulator YiaG